MLIMMFLLQLRMRLLQDYCEADSELNHSDLARVDVCVCVCVFVLVCMICTDKKLLNIQ